MENESQVMLPDTYIAVRLRAHRASATRLRNAIDDAVERNFALGDVEELERRLGVEEDFIKRFASASRRPPTERTPE